MTTIAIVSAAYERGLVVKNCTTFPVHTRTKSGPAGLVWSTVLGTIKSASTVSSTGAAGALAVAQDFSLSEAGIREPLPRFFDAFLALSLRNLTREKSSVLAVDSGSRFSFRSATSYS